MALHSTRKNVQVQDRRLRVAEMYLRGKTQAQISEMCAVNVATISRDLKVIRQEWLDSRVRDFDQAKAEELAKIDRLEAEYWDAWHRSRVESVERFVARRGKALTVRTKKVQRDGNPAFLAGVMDCITQRCKILGIYEATKISIDWRRAAEEQGHNAGELFEHMVNAYISALDGDTA